MSQLRDLNKHINDILLLLLNHQNLCKYLYYRTDGENNPLDLPELSYDERMGLLYSQIHPFPYIPSDEEIKVGTYLNVYFERIKHSNSKYFNNSILVFDILCHRDQWKMRDELRPYSILAEIQFLFDDKKTVGMSRTVLERADLFRVNKSFVGYKVQFPIADIAK